MYQRVLIAVDGSPWSDAAAAYAIALASRIGATLRILSVTATPTISTMPEVMGASDEMVMQAVERQDLDMLAQIAAQAEQAGVACEVLSKWGGAPEMIMHTATEEQCDLIVLGSRALSGWKRLMMGHVSNVVTAKAQQPVLVVKQYTASGAERPGMAPRTSRHRRLALVGCRRRSRHRVGKNTAVGGVRALRRAWQATA